MPTDPSGVVDHPDGPVPGGTLRFGLGTDPWSIDPRLVVDREGTLVVGALFEPLVRLGDDGTVVPALAERWEIEDGGRAFVLHLREQEFHDATPVTAADVVRGFETLLDPTRPPASSLGYLLRPIVGAERTGGQGGPLAGLTAIDERTLRIELEAPQPGFLEVLTHPSLVPVPAIAELDPDAFAAEPIGNGPFAMAGPRERGAFIRLVRVAGHHREPLLDEVLFQVYLGTTPGAGQWEDLLGGTLQVAELAPEQREEALELLGRGEQGRGAPGVLDAIGATVYLYGFELSSPPYDDVRLREALSLALDRDMLATHLLQGAREPATAIVPPSVLGSQPGACRHCRHDPARARELLAEVVAELEAQALADWHAEVEEELRRAAEDGTEDGEGDPAGVDDGSGADGDAGPEVELPEPPRFTPAELIGTVRLTHSRGRTHAAIAERMAADIERTLGLNVELDARDIEPFLRAVRAGEVPLFRLGWEPDTPGPDPYLWPLFHSSQRGVENLTGYASAEVDGWLEQARATPQPLHARASYRRAERAILADVAVLPLLWYRNDRVTSEEVRDLVWGPLDRLDLAQVWLDPAA